MTSSPAPNSLHRPRRLVTFIRIALSASLGVAAAVLIACGSTGKGLIPASNGGPLKSDIELVDHAAQEGNGNCSATEAALLKTDQDFAGLPASVDSGLRDTLRQGISNLRSVALSLCTQPLSKPTTATTPQTTSSATTTTPTTTSTTTPSPTTTPTSSAPAPTPERAPEGGESPSPGGGTPAPGAGPGKAPDEGAGGAAPEQGESGAGGHGGGK